MGKSVPKSSLRFEESTIPCQQKCLYASTSFPSRHHSFNHRSACTTMRLWTPCTRDSLQRTFGPSSSLQIRPQTRLSDRSGSRLSPPFLSYVHEKLGGLLRCQTILTKGVRFNLAFQASNLFFSLRSPKARHPCLRTTRCKSHVHHRGLGNNLATKPNQATKPHA